ncbi:hypothetical protein V8E55_008520 [Tylopilus felleus]
MSCCLLGRSRVRNSSVQRQPPFLAILYRSHLRSIQTRTNTLVSGSNVLQFLDRTYCPDSGLDLYIRPGHSFEVAWYFVEIEGYRYVPRESQPKDWKVVVHYLGTEGLTMLRVLHRGNSNHGYPEPEIRDLKRRASTKRPYIKVQVMCFGMLNVV